MLVHNEKKTSVFAMQAIDARISEVISRVFFFNQKYPYYVDEDTWKFHVFYQLRRRFVTKSKLISD